MVHFLEKKQWFLCWSSQILWLLSTSCGPWLRSFFFRHLHRDRKTLGCTMVSWQCQKEATFTGKPGRLGVFRMFLSWPQTSVFSFCIWFHMVSSWAGWKPTGKNPKKKNIQNDYEKRRKKNLELHFCPASLAFSSQSTCWILLVFLKVYKYIDVSSEKINHQNKEREANLWRFYLFLLFLLFR